MTISTKHLICITALVAVFLCLLSAASGHGLYEMACCSNRDCEPVADERVTQTKDGFLVDGEFIPHGDTRIRRPINEQYHLCKSAYSGALLCIYPKLQGF